MTIAVLALQGAFIEHEHMLQKLGADTIELRKAGDLQKDFDGLILPGGESTVQGKLLHDLDMFEPLKEKIKRVILFSIVKICGFVDSVRAWHRTLAGYCYKLSRRSFNCCFTA